MPKRPWKSTNRSSRNNRVLKPKSVGEGLTFISSSLRRRVAREAANLIYSGIEKEYKQAKLKAAKTLRTHFLPTNFEVAVELDTIAQEREGPTRQERLVRLRTEALELMRILKSYSPRLVGSVWRGTASRESDIDIAVFHDKEGEILQALGQFGIGALHAEWIDITEKGRRRASYHVYLELSTRDKVEIIVRSLEEQQQKAKCEIYGDEIVGLTVQDLEKLIGENPTQRFVPQ